MAKIPSTSRSATPPNFYQAVYKLVRVIPKGRVMTYGQIAAILGSPRGARAVGYAMRACGPYPDVPWQRVINSRGRISAGSDVERPILQKMMLESEGVRFDKDERCDLEKYRWEPRNPEPYFYHPSAKMPF